MPSNWRVRTSPDEDRCAAGRQRAVVDLDALASHRTDSIRTHVLIPCSRRVPLAYPLCSEYLAYVYSATSIRSGSRRGEKRKVANLMALAVLARWWRGDAPLRDCIGDAGRGKYRDNGHQGGGRSTPWCRTWSAAATSKPNRCHPPREPVPERTVYQIHRRRRDDSSPGPGS